MTTNRREPGFVEIMFGPLLTWSIVFLPISLAWLIFCLALLVLVGVPVLICSAVGALRRKPPTSPGSLPPLELLAPARPHQVIPAPGLLGSEIADRTEAAARHQAAAEAELRRVMPEWRTSDLPEWRTGGQVVRDLRKWQRPVEGR